jgi:hypothetical protein
VSTGEILLAAVKAFIPPYTNDLDIQQRWRWVVFGTTLALTVALAAHIAASYGLIPVVTNGFAMKDDVARIQRRVDVIVTINLEHELRWKTLELCREKDPNKRDELNTDIGRLQWDYREVTKEWYLVPSCDKL